MKKLFSIVLSLSFLLTSGINSQQADANTGKGSMKYEGSKRFYVTPSGQEILDKRRVGPIYPNIFDVARKGSPVEYIATEDEEKGCNLEKLFMETVYKKHGFNVRKYLNALATPAGSCSKLGSAEEQALCNKFHSSPACSGATPVAFRALPLSSGQTYLTLGKHSPVSCQAEADVILKDTYVSKQTQEWSKIEGDLQDKQRSNMIGSLKSKAPVGQIKSTVLAKNPKATQRDIDFAVNDWVYSESKKASFSVSEAEVKRLVEQRYSPSSAMKNIADYKAQIASNCAGKESRYNAKVYAEGVNIPAHSVLAYGDYVDVANHCVCK
jgi:hypothetical protein